MIRQVCLLLLFFSLNVAAQEDEAAVPSPTDIEATDFEATDAQAGWPSVSRWSPASRRRYWHRMSGDVRQAAAP